MHSQIGHQTHHKMANKNFMIENKEKKLWEFYVFHLLVLILFRKTIGHRKEKARLTILASLIHDKLAKVFEHFNLLYNFNLSLIYDKLAKVFEHFNLLYNFNLIIKEKKEEES